MTESTDKEPAALQAAAACDCHLTKIIAQNLGGGVRIELLLVASGAFGMGSCKYDWNCTTHEQPQHRVTIARPFYLGRYQVTQAQWQLLMGRNPSHFRGEDLPVEAVSWEECRDFCRVLAEKTGCPIRLPSEAEWEYACRAGTHGDYGCFDDGPSDVGLDDLAWYCRNSAQTTHAVGTKKPNPQGLFDMHGNVWEWCADVWHENYNAAPYDGSAWLAGGDAARRVVRGGCFGDQAVFCRSATRNHALADGRWCNIGLRVAADAL